MALTIFLAWFFRRVFSRYIAKSVLLQKSDPTNYTFLKYIITAVIYVVGIGLAVFQIPPLRSVAQSMLAGAGIMAVAIGFASQQALSNIVSGVLIIIFKPYSIGERITVRDSYRGMVEDITLRHTVIRDFENRRIVIPNSVISNEVVVNSDMTDEKVCRLVEIGISYDSDIELAKSIMMDEVKKHPSRVEFRTEEMIERGVDEIPVRVISLGDSSVNIRAWAWAGDFDSGFRMHCDLLESIKKRFDNSGIEIPFPHRTLVYKNDVQISAENQVN